MLEYLSILSNFLFKPNLSWVFKGSSYGRELKLLAPGLHLLKKCWKSEPWYANIHTYEV